MYTWCRMLLLTLSCLLVCLAIPQAAVPQGALPAGAPQAAGAQPAASAPAVSAPGAQLEKLAGGFEFTEGPTSDRSGNVYFTDQPNDRIMKWGVDGKLTTFLQPAGRANGMFFDAKGNLLACADEHTELWSIAPDGTHTVLAGQYGGNALNGPNDVWARPDGAIYFTDPFYRRSWWNYSARPQDGEHVYFLAADQTASPRDSPATPWRFPRRSSTRAAGSRRRTAPSSPFPIACRSSR